MVRLLRHEKEPHLVLDNFEEGHRPAIGDSPFVEADLRDPAAVQAVFKAHPDIDIVIDFAAYIAVGESVREPAKYWRNNFVGALNLTDAMLAANVQSIVFSSTAAVYGEPVRIPIDEEHPKAPTSCYGETKLAVEHLLEHLDTAQGIKSVRLRYFNAAGADPSGEIGEAHRVEEHLIPLAIAAARGARPPLKVFGTDWPTPDGTCLRDYIHVNDLVSAHLLAVRHLRNGGESRAYNLGTGTGHSVKEVLDVVGAAVGTPVPFEEAPRRPGDPARLIASAAAIMRDWGWVPEHPSLDEIAKDAWRWHRAQAYG